MTNMCILGFNDPSHHLTSVSSVMILAGVGGVIEVGPSAANLVTQAVTEAFNDKAACARYADNALTVTVSNTGACTVIVFSKGGTTVSATFRASDVRKSPLLTRDS